MYLHDIGHFLSGNEDHAILSENFAVTFFEKNNYNKKNKEILHCIRAHRNKDVKPKTLEAKIIVTVDSLSHITNGVYWDMIKEGRSLEKVLAKIERDYRDLGFFPEVSKMMKNICENWRKIVTEYNNMI